MTATRVASSSRCTERVEQRGVVLDVAALDRQRPLSGGGQHLVGLEHLGDRVEAVEAGETGAGEHDGVERRRR